MESRGRWAGMGRRVQLGRAVPGPADIGQFAADSYFTQPLLTAPAGIGGLWDPGAGAVTVGGTNTLTLNAATGIELDGNAGALGH